MSARFVAPPHASPHISKFFQCPLCPKSYDYRGSLDIHMRTHTGDAPFACPHCPLRTKDKSNLRRHIKRRHRWPWLFRCAEFSASKQKWNDFSKENETFKDWKLSPFLTSKQIHLQTDVVSSWHPDYAFLPNSHNFLRHPGNLYFIACFTCKNP